MLAGKAASDLSCSIVTPTTCKASWLRGLASHPAHANITYLSLLPREMISVCMIAQLNGYYTASGFEPRCVPFATCDLAGTMNGARCKVVESFLLFVNVGQKAAASIIIAICTSFQVSYCHAYQVDRFTVLSGDHAADQRTR